MVVVKSDKINAESRFPTGPGPLHRHSSIQNCYGLQRYSSSTIYHLTLLSYNSQDDLYIYTIKEAARLDSVKDEARVIKIDI